jgi:hypothetical protein
VFDQFGNPTGGVRSPYLDVPRQTYAWYNNGGGCGSVGHLVPLPQSTLAALYPTPRDYQSNFVDASIALLAAGWVPEIDARNMIIDGVQSVS